MAPKKKKEVSKSFRPVHSVKYVARAGMWCTTIIDEKGQRQSWSMEKP